MFWFKILSKKLMRAKIPIATVNAVMMDIDVDADGCVSVSEIIDGIKRAMV